MRLAIVPVLALLLGCVQINVTNVEDPPTRMATKTAHEVWSSASKSVVNMSVYDGSSTAPFTWGTAWCLSVADVENANIDLPEWLVGKKAYIFLTAKHLADRDRKRFDASLTYVDVDEKFSVKVMKYGSNGMIMGSTEVREGGENTFLVRRSDSIDAAIVILLTTLELDIEPLDVVHEGISDQLRVGQQVYTVGCQSVRTPLFKSGMISALFSNMSVVDVGIDGGASGGPVLNLDGQVVGMTVARYDCTSSLAIPMNKVYNFLREVGMTHPNMCGQEESDAR